MIVTLYVSAIWVPVFPDRPSGAAGIGTIAAYLGGHAGLHRVFRLRDAVPARVDRGAREPDRPLQMAPTVRGDGTPRESGKLRQQADHVSEASLSGFTSRRLRLTLLTYWTGPLWDRLLRRPELLARLPAHPVRPAARPGCGSRDWPCPHRADREGSRRSTCCTSPLCYRRATGGPSLLAWRAIAYYGVLAIGAVRGGRCGQGPARRRSNRPATLTSSATDTSRTVPMRTDSPRGRPRP